MDLSGIRLVAADMDGTLLHSDGKLDPDFDALFAKIKTLGIKFAVASGRQFFNLRNRFEHLKEDMIFIAENGSYVVYREEELLVQAMDNSVVNNLLAIAGNIPGISVVLCGKKSAYIQDNGPEFLQHVKMYYDRCEVVADLMKVEQDEFLKIAIFDFAGSEKNSYPHFRHLEDSLQVKISGNHWLDLSHRLANKGRALALLQERFTVSFNSTMVFGDYLNDLEMMQQCYFSFAMENAHPDIKKTANFIAKSNDENGVSVILKEMIKQHDLQLPAGIDR